MVDDPSRHEEITHNVPSVPQLDEETIPGVAIYLQSRLQENEAIQIDHEGRRLVIERVEGEPKQANEWAPIRFRAHDSKSDQVWFSASLEGLLRAMVGERASIHPLIAAFSEG